MSESCVLVIAPVATGDAIEAVVAERRDQDRQWGEQNHNPVEWLSILAEEVGEAAQMANAMHWHPERGYDGNRGAFRDELIQIAAVAVAAVECLDREIERDYREYQDALGAEVQS